MFDFYRKDPRAGCTNNLPWLFLAFESWNHYFMRTCTFRSTQTDICVLQFEEPLVVIIVTPFWCKLSSPFLRYHQRFAAFLAFTLTQFFLLNEHKLITRILMSVSSQWDDEEILSWIPVVPLSSLQIGKLANWISPSPKIRFTILCSSNNFFVLVHLYFIRGCFLHVYSDCMYGVLCQENTSGLPP